MALFLIAAVVALVALGFWIKSKRNRRLVDEHTITPEGLHALLDAKQDVLIFDVRQPLDMLADSEIIPGAKRLASTQFTQLFFGKPRTLATTFSHCCPPSRVSCRLPSSVPTQIRPAVSGDSLIE